MKLRLSTPPDFHFLSAVCSHGFFLLAPNCWHPPTRTLTTTITFDDKSAAVVAVEQAAGNTVSVRSAEHLAAAHRPAVRAAVRRMLRLNEDLSAFHALCRESTTHAQAAAIGFGRLIRGGSIFEDLVKVICTCNVTWRQTVAMVQALVEHWGVPLSPAPALEDPPSRGFPTPQSLAGVRESTLKVRARVGYRAEFIRRLARDVVDGRLDLEALERFDGPSDELHKLLKQIHGIGDYAAGNLCMLLGRYDRLAVDTEMVRFLKQHHPTRRWTPAAMRAHYEAWRPYQFLAYWFELWHDYVRRHGQADLWLPDATGKSITGHP